MLLLCCVLFAVAGRSKVVESGKYGKSSTKNETALLVYCEKERNKNFIHNTYLYICRRKDISMQYIRANIICVQNVSI